MKILAEAAYYMFLVSLVILASSLLVGAVSLCLL